MSRLISELETSLRLLLDEYAKLLALMEKHAVAMQGFDLNAMDDLARAEEASRSRIVALEQRRRIAAQQIAKALNVQGELTLRRLAQLQPAHAISLLQLRRQLKDAVEQMTSRNKISGKVATAVLGHLNTVVRLLAGAVERAGVYTKSGIPRVATRIGALEAVG
jgi:hypothetical protein